MERIELFLMELPEKALVAAPRKFINDDSNASTIDELNRFYLSSDGDNSYYSIPKHLENAVLDHISDKDPELVIVNLTDTEVENPIAFSKIYENAEAGVVSVVWGDGKPTVARCNKDDTYDFSVGLALCVAKHMFTNFGMFATSVKGKKYYKDLSKPVVALEPKENTKDPAPVTTAVVTESAPKEKKKSLKQKIQDFKKSL